jgi:mono/diheme cytochrome c family protein
VRRIHRRYFTARRAPCRAAGYRPRAMRLRAFTAIGIFGLACTPADDQLSPLAREGEKVYQNVCIACHNGNPNLDGALGPANAGASEELLSAKVLRGEYPLGYTPKRPGSTTMPRFEYLADKIPALAAYLGQVREPKQ